MPVGLTRDAGWQIGVSRTVAHSVEAVWDLLTSERGTALWLGTGLAWPAAPGDAYELDDGTVGEVRSFRPHDRMRLTWWPPSWDHESTVQIAVAARGDRTRITFHQERLVDATERERQREHWIEVADAVVAALDG